MQRYKWISVVPVTARLAVPIDDGDGGLRIGFSQQRVGKGKADSACANDEVVGFNVFQGVFLSLFISVLMFQPNKYVR